MHVVVIYATVEGQTRKICRFCADQLFALGHTVEMLAAADAEACAQEAAPPRAAADAAGDLFAGQVYPMMTYRDALHRVLKRMMEITERDRYGNTTRRPLHEDALLALARTIEQDIDAFPDLPLAPLDTLRIALQERGYRMGELSGRAFQVEWVERRDGR